MFPILVRDITLYVSHAFLNPYKILQDKNYYNSYFHVKILKFKEIMLKVTWLIGIRNEKVTQFTCRVWLNRHCSRDLMDNCQDLEILRFFNKHTDLSTGVKVSTHYMLL